MNSGRVVKIQRSDFFRFEEDFVEENVRCIPMIVRYKLDACGVKLKLVEWSRMTTEEREHLASMPCVDPEEVRGYREYLCALIHRRTGGIPTFIPVPGSPAWSRLDEIPYTIQEKLRGMASSLSLKQWQSLSALQRFALLKLSYGGHENKNFPRALKEFGL
jgi:hypothetical protein